MNQSGINIGPRSGVLNFLNAHKPEVANKNGNSSNLPKSRTRSGALRIDSNEPKKGKFSDSNPCQDSPSSDNLLSTLSPKIRQSLSKPDLTLRSTNKILDSPSSLSPACTQHLTTIHRLTQDKSDLLKKMKENDEQKKTSEAKLLVEKRLRLEHQQGEDWAKKELKSKNLEVLALEIDVRKKDEKVKELEDELKKRKAIEVETAKSKKKFKFTIEVEVDGEKLEGSAVSVE